MKFLVLLLLSMCMLVSCGMPTKQYYEERVTTIVIDSCEYLAGTEHFEFTHKGNCKFCAERRKKEIKQANSLFDF